MEKELRVDKAAFRIRLKIKAVAFVCYFSKAADEFGRIHQLNSNQTKERVSLSFCLWPAQESKVKRKIRPP